MSRPTEDFGRRISVVPEPTFLGSPPAMVTSEAERKTILSEPAPFPPRRQISPGASGGRPVPPTGRRSLTGDLDRQRVGTPRLREFEFRPKCKDDAQRQRSSGGSTRRGGKARAVSISDEDGVLVFCMGDWHEH